MPFVGTTIDYTTIAENVRRDQELAAMLDALAQAFYQPGQPWAPSPKPERFSDDLIVPDSIEPATLDFLKELVKQATPDQELTAAEGFEREMTRKPGSSKVGKKARHAK
jgi:hypothetical protein